MFAVGDTVGDYDIVAKLKSGGMATLFLGRRTGAEGFSRYVAIKVVHEHLASDPTFVRMFVDEALLSAKIQHPNVVHVEELRELAGRHFLVMEYVHGCALSTLISALRKRGRTLNPELATYIAVKVAEGLHAAHETAGADGQPLGVVHRDVTPQNILLAYRGHVKLIDFGVAKARGRAQQTTGASLKGKIAYMSPEQAFGRPVDRRTDIYALGVVLWEMLTGRRAFHADNDFALLELVRDPKLQPASSFVPSVPPALDAVIARATAREPEQRFESAQQLRKALAQAMPSALALDASDLEKLLAATLGDEMEADRRALPESATGVVSTALLPPPVEAEQIVATMTISAPGLLPPSVREPNSAASSVRAKTPATSPTGTVILPDHAAPAAAEAPRPRTHVRLVVAVGAAILLAALAGGVVAWRLAAPASEIRATELPRTSAPVEVAAPDEAAHGPPQTPAPTNPPVQAPAPAMEPAAPLNEPAAEQAAATPGEPAPPAPSAGDRDPPRRVARPRKNRDDRAGAVPLADEF